MTEKIIQTDNLEIEGNVLKYENSIIQISNISYLNISLPPKKKYPVWALLGLISSVPLLTLGQLLAAVLAFLICGSVILYIYGINREAQEYLIIGMNCGESILLKCDDRKFLKRVIEIIRQCFNKDNVQYKIDFNHCKIEEVKMAKKNIIENSNVVGDGNIGNLSLGSNLVSQGNVNVIKESDDWEKAANIFDELAKKYFEGSVDRNLCDTACKYCKDKDENRLKQLIWKNEGSFRMILFRAASTGITEILKHLIGLALS